MRSSQLDALVVVILSLFRLSLAIVLVNISNASLIALGRMVTSSELVYSIVTLGQIALRHFYLLAAHVSTHEVFI